MPSESCHVLSHRRAQGVFFIQICALAFCPLDSATWTCHKSAGPVLSQPRTCRIMFTEMRFNVTAGLSRVR